jgi:hypothetical protein
MKNKRKIERSLPNSDTLELNIKQVIERGVFPLVTAYSNSIHTNHTKDKEDKDKE